MIICEQKEGNIYTFNFCLASFSRTSPASTNALMITSNQAKEIQKTSSSHRNILKSNGTRQHFFFF
jgi:hypothetical protein